MLPINDQFVFDNLEPVTLSATSGQVVASIEQALRRPVTTAEAAASDGAVTQSDVKWHLADDELPQPPQVAGTILDAGDVPWRILRVERHAATRRWCCWCRNLVIAENLAQHVTIQRARWQRLPSGYMKPIWISTHLNLPARIQPRQKLAERPDNSRVPRVTHDIYLGQTIAVGHNHRVLHDGVVYRVLGCDMPQRIDRLFVIHGAEMES